MNVYEFEKSLLERLEESCNVLQCKGSPVPASDVREEWACHVELKIEPAGESNSMLLLLNNHISSHKYFHWSFSTISKKPKNSMSFVHLHRAFHSQVGKQFGKLIVQHVNNLRSSIQQLCLAR